jgi:hypothetical protein
VAEVPTVSAEALEELAPEQRQPIVPRSALRRDPLVPLRSGSPRAEAQALAGSPPAAEPTIRVSIGRVEVRATAPTPPPAPAARPAGPRLTLEEYVRRRNEGGL